ncbi:MAG: phosphohistidine phosphatase [Solirubrobacteraceae bacterium]|jgi:phosphohistidine phosphatase|nr:phosphohistidine phosphatase [Solirubrobacteraceae bacterium]
MIWLLRHGDAASGSPDEDRPLNERGVRQAQAAGRALERLGVHIDVCLTSPKRRALETARLACNELGVAVRVEPSLAGEPFDVHELTAGLGDVVLVGHDPSFSLTLHDLTGAQARLRKGGLAGIEKGELLVLVRPSELEAIAGRAEVPS